MSVRINLRLTMKQIDEVEKLADFVEDVIFDYATKFKLGRFEEAKKSLKRLEDFKLVDYKTLFALNVEDLCFFVGFNKKAKINPEVCEAVACKIAGLDAYGLSLNTFCTLLANSEVLNAIPFDFALVLIDLLNEKVEGTCSYHYELDLLKAIRRRLEQRLTICELHLGDYFTEEDYDEAREMVDMINDMVTTSTLRKAKADGWSFVKSV